MPLGFTYSKCVIQWLYYIHRVVQPSPQSILEHFDHPRRKPVPMSSDPPSLPPAPDHQGPTLCVCGSACSARFPPVESHRVCPSVSAPLTERRVLRVRLRGSECQGFSPLHGRVILPGWRDTCVIHPSVDSQAVCTSQLVWLVC